MSFNDNSDPKSAGYYVVASSGGAWRLVSRDAWCRIDVTLSRGQLAKIGVL